MCSLYYLYNPQTWAHKDVYCLAWCMTGPANTVFNAHNRGKRVTMWQMWFYISYLTKVMAYCHTNSIWHNHRSKPLQDICSVALTLCDRVNGGWWRVQELQSCLEITCKSVKRFNHLQSRFVSVWSTVQLCCPWFRSEELHTLDHQSIVESNGKYECCSYTWYIWTSW